MSSLKIESNKSYTIYALISIFSVLALWQVVSYMEWLNPNLIPSPTRIFIAFREWVQSGDFWIDLQDSIWRAITGWLIGSILGIFIGLLTGRLIWLNRILAPLMNVFRAFPPVALLPVFITFLGIGDISKVFSIAFACIFPVWINTHIGSNTVPQEYLRIAQLLVKSKTRIFLSVILPASMNYIVAGLRQAMAMAFIMLYVSELAGASSGIGYQISSSHLAYRFDKMFSALFILGGLAAIADMLLNRLLLYFFPWLRFNR